MLPYMASSPTQTSLVLGPLHNGYSIEETHGVIVLWPTVTYNKTANTPFPKTVPGG